MWDNFALTHSYREVNDCHFEMMEGSENLNVGVFSREYWKKHSVIEWNNHLSVC